MHIRFPSIFLTVHVCLNNNRENWSEYIYNIFLEWLIVSSDLFYSSHNSETLYITYMGWCVAFTYVGFPIRLKLVMAEYSFTWYSLCCQRYLTQLKLTLNESCIVPLAMQCAIPLHSPWWIYKLISQVGS